MRLSWLAASSWLRGTRFGTDASLAGIQNRLTASMRKLATSRYSSDPDSGMLTNRLNRSRSQSTIVRRRSHRSAKAPASGPSSTAGSSRKTRTPPVAYAFWLNPSTSWAASAVVARKPSQSPKLDSASAW